MIIRLLDISLALLLIPIPSAALVAPQGAFPPATPESQGLSAEALAELALEVQGYVDRDLIVGGELLVVKNRRTVLHETFGHADLDEGIPWTVGTVANIRSMTKPVTGAAAQILIDRGALALDDAVAEYLPDRGSHMKEEFTVHVKTGQLWIDIPITGDLELVPGEEEGRWSLAAAPGIGVWFERDEDGAVDCLRIQEGPLLHEAPRKGTPREAEVREGNRANPEALAAYLGLYDDPGTDRNARIFIDRDYLALEGGSGNVVHLWRYPGTERWIVREREELILSFQKEGGAVMAFTLQMVGVSGESAIFRRIR